MSVAKVPGRPVTRPSTPGKRVRKAENVTTPPAGHRTLPHTADVQIEAWAPTRDECLRQAVLGSVEMFLDTTGAQPTGTHTFRVDADDEQLLVAVLEEIVYELDTTGKVPVQTTVTSHDTGCDLRFDTVEARTLPQVGAAPKAVSLHQLRFAGTEDGWSCLVTWDV